jgi:arabinogalactan endo-1,4-beta-galactosidase
LRTHVLHTLLATLVVAAAAVAPASSALVTFRVDMSTQAGYGLFDPGADAVVVRGSFNGWSGNQNVLGDPDLDLIFERTINLPSATHEYKFVIVPGEGADVWESSIPNRVVEVGGDDITLDAVFFDDDDTVPIPPRDVEVSFTVDMSLAIVAGDLDPANDLVVVRGNHPALGDWGGTGAPLARDGASSHWSGWAQFEELSNRPVDYKFVVLEGGEPATAHWEESIDDRRLRILGDEPDSLPPPGGNGYAEFFTEPTYFDHDANWVPADRMIGADLSFLPRLVAAGAEYRVDGVPKDPLDIFREHGFTLVRLRLWHTPDEHWHGLDSTIAFAHDVKAAGFDLMLDIHYSDFWADPGQQTKPAAWEGLGFPTLVDSVYAYTNAAVRKFRDEGVLPAYVQIGNEIDGGLLWDEGRVGWPGSEWDTPAQWSQLTQLLSAAAAAVRDSLAPSEVPRVVVHVAEGGDNARSRWFYDDVLAGGVDFDVIGLSFYPWWHGTLDDLRANIGDLSERYGKEIQIVETAYPWTLDGNDATGNFVTEPGQLPSGYPATPEGQLDFLRDALAAIEGAPGGLGTGFVYWEPAFLSLPGGPPNPYENLILFDFDGNALPGLGLVVPWGTGIDDGAESHGAAPSVSPRMPNPFDSEVAVSYVVPEDGAHVDLRIYDASGRLVATLIDERQPGGRREALWAGTSAGGSPAAAGVYFWRVSIGEATENGKIVLVR